MAIIGKLTFTVITCSKDLALLERYLASVHMHFNPAELEEIIIVFNDEYRYLPEFKSCLAKFSALPIRQLWSNEIWPEQNLYNWQSQQQLKLLVSELVKTEWYIINDSKDFYYARVAYSDFISDSGQSLLYLRTIDFRDQWFGPASHHRSQYEYAYDLLGLRFSDYKIALRTQTASVCPCHTQTIQELTQYLRNKLATIFPWLLLLQINHKAMYTEYALISAWLQKHDLLLQQYSPTITTAGFHDKVACNKDLRKGT